MYSVLRIVFCIIASMCAAVTIFIFVYFGVWGFLPLGGTVVFAALMFTCKRAQESEQTKKNPPAPKGDFITGKVKDDEAKDE